MDKAVCAKKQKQDRFRSHRQAYLSFFDNFQGRRIVDLGLRAGYRAKSQRSDIPKFPEKNRPLVFSISTVSRIS